ncbi:2-amino-4-hydroxy-6-hydroxymethyldihydropteridine diphosphokinase [Bartonella choladocola]|uniref:2-amino-4-hydroxy-6-hydroxymethyldihydropteridine pyrophosphokinase n=1 Tax=Bartonella choladocola TaxID=2750995 RepID=A0A1U9MHR4_9HYPH|nr:2-amino-4-hydroxy-6-hydroxymethyldihydropteridine diphosphokinase [Bartonella choladocola]AQT47191.1 2-amino-4-hydroxy-6-hydroxymethyldihydropteridine diphosphokinase [Bartonella choladocola]
MNKPKAEELRDNGWKRAWLGLGGNIGDVIKTLGNALEDMAHAPAIRLKAVSSYYRTPPWGKTDQNQFVNVCCEIETGLSPEELLQFCLNLEKKYGRLREVKWGPRTLDIDVLAYENIDHYHSETLDIPHPLMTKRAFVLEPLNEIAPDLVINGREVKAWKNECQNEGIVVLPTHFTIR